MIRMEQYEYIRTAGRVYGKSIKQICRETGHSRATVQLAVDRLEIFQDGRRLARHPRLFGKNKWQLDPDHHLDLLAQRSFVFRAAWPIWQWWSQWPPGLAELLARFQESQGETAGLKDFIEVLKLYRDHPPEKVAAAVSLALNHGLRRNAGIKHLLAEQPEENFPPLPGW